MKSKVHNYVLVIVLIFSPVSLFAGADEDEALKVFAETALESMAKDFLKKQANQYLLEQMGQTALDEFLKETFGEQSSSGVVNQAFAAYSFYNSAKAFDESGTQSQKYYATVGMIGAGVSFINPAVGSIIQLVNVGTQLGSAAVNKKRVENLIKLQQEIIEIYERVVAKQSIMIVADVKRLNFYYRSYFEYLLKAVQVEELMNKKCDIIPPRDAKLTIKCFEYGLQKHINLKMSVSFLSQALSFTNQYFDLDDYLKDQELEITKDELLKNIEVLKSQLQEVDRSLEELYSKLADNLLEMALDNAKAEGDLVQLRNNCLIEANKVFLFVNKLEFELLNKSLVLPQVNLLVTTRAKELTKLSNSINQCTKIQGMSPAHLASLEQKRSFKDELVGKDIKLFYENKEFAKEDQ